jgi:Zn-dependent M28 family amino/carboxypeptidase
MRLRIPIVLAASLSLFTAQTVVFHAVPKETVLARLRQAERNNQERETSLGKLLEETGCKGEWLVEQPVKHAKIPNLICTLPGQTDSRILVTAHTDHVKEGDGTVDNWSGASMLPDLYESLRVSPRRHTFVFIGFTQEEEGLVGSRSYARQLTPEQKAKISALVNMDSLGLSPTAVWLSHANPELAKIARQVAGVTKLPLQAINVDQVGYSDAEAFAGLHIRSVTFHSVTQQTWAILHSNRDTFRAIQVDDYYDSYRFLTAYLAWIDTALDPEKPVLR